jgi:hypothetical protein
MRLTVRTSTNTFEVECVTAQLQSDPTAAPRLRLSFDPFFSSRPPEPVPYRVPLALDIAADDETAANGQDDWLESDVALAQLVREEVTSAEALGWSDLHGHCQFFALRVAKRMRDEFKLRNARHRDVEAQR